MSSEPREVQGKKRNRRQRSCINCNERKVKCDLKNPCSECTRKHLKCNYIQRSISHLSKTSIRQVIHRMSVEMDVYKQLETYWRNLAQGALSGLKQEIQVALSPLGSLTPSSSQFQLPSDSLPPSTSSSQSCEAQCCTILTMFSKLIATTLPHFQSNFNRRLATIYWQLLTRPIHVDLVEDFEDTSFSEEKSMAMDMDPSSSSSTSPGRNTNCDDEIRYISSSSSNSCNSSSVSSPIPPNPTSTGNTPTQTYGLACRPPSYHPPSVQTRASSLLIDPMVSSSSDSDSDPEKVCMNDSCSSSSQHTNTCRHRFSLSGSNSSLTPSLASVNLTTASEASKFQPLPTSFDKTVDGVVVAPTGRLIDSLSDFLHVQMPTTTDLMSLLEYSLAFLSGLTLMGMPQVAQHVALNSDRILNEMVFKRRHEFTGSIPARFVNCTTVLAVHYDRHHRIGALVSTLLLAHQVACEHSLHTKEPVLVSRVYLTLLWYAQTQNEREEYFRLAIRFHPSMGGALDWRCKFSYLSAVFSSQSPTDHCSSSVNLEELLQLASNSPYPTVADLASTAPSEHQLSQAELDVFCFWRIIGLYYAECELMMDMLEKFGIHPVTLINFKGLLAIMKAELGPRIGQNDWPIEVASQVEQLLMSLSDIDTLIVTSNLASRCRCFKKKSAKFSILGRSHLVSDYLLSILETVPVPPAHMQSFVNLHMEAPEESPTFSSPSVHDDPASLAVLSNSS